MVREALQPTMTWAEDRATQRCDPSAVPGAKTEGRAVHRINPWTAQTSFLRDWHQSDKPSQQDAAILTTRCRSSCVNRKPAKFQFTLNQDRDTGVANSPAGHDVDSLVRSRGGTQLPHPRRNDTPGWNRFAPRRAPAGSLFRNPGKRMAWNRFTIRGEVNEVEQAITLPAPPPAALPPETFRHGFRTLRTCCAAHWLKSAIRKIPAPRRS
jgi:hypothetical protein